jgi:hypothetical protein
MASWTTEKKHKVAPSGLRRWWRDRRLAAARPRDASAKPQLAAKPEQGA